MSINFTHSISLQTLNTLGLPGHARYYCQLQYTQELKALSDLLNNAPYQSLPYFILGGGSNIVITQDFPGVVLHIQNKGISLIAEDENFYYVQAAAGEKWQTLVEWTLQHDITGLENLSWIPGSVGAAPVQNIGAYGVELSNIFYSLVAFEVTQGEFITLMSENCKFAYRDSIFKHKYKNRMIIWQVTLALPKHYQPNLAYQELAQAVLKNNLSPTAQQISEIVIQIRQTKLPNPTQLGNAGSFFKNPMVTATHYKKLQQEFPNIAGHIQANGNYKLAAGWLIQECGWKGKTLGKAGVYEKQALVLVNLGGATGAEIMLLAKQIQHNIFQRFAVELEIEPSCL